MWRRRPRDDDEGSLPIALMLTMLATMLSGVIAAITSNNTVIARELLERPRLLDAAQTGLQVVVGHIRLAADASGNGVLTLLPCGPYTGAVGTASTTTGPGTRETYTVTITYKTAGGTAAGCTPGSGPASIPRYADLVSTGTDTWTGLTRTLNSRYTVGSTNANVAGGAFRASSIIGGVNQPCIDAGSASPAAGTPVRLAICVSGSQQQTFAYNTRFQLFLVSSPTDANPQGMCVDGGSLPHPSAAVALTMQPCMSTGFYRQSWFQDDSNNLQGTSDGVNLDGHCLKPQNSAIPTPMVLQPSCNVQAFNSDSAVGAGAAGPLSEQLVNYGEFGRCLDVAEYNWQRYLFWLWQCKQAPTIAGVNWNQKWEVPAMVAGSSGTSGYIFNRPPALTGLPACLQSTMTSSSSAYVTLVQCPTTAASGALKWTVYGNTGIYATSYTIVDSAGNCLTPVPPGLPNSLVYDSGPGVSPAVTMACDGSTLQKWDANPDTLLPSPLSLFNEK
jgi:hypothetical protein